jgi:hypothetical protein
MPGLFVEPHKLAPGLGTAAVYGGDNITIMGSADLCLCECARARRFDC